MADDVDVANERTTIYLEAAIKRATGAVRNSAEASGRTDCRSCTDEIEPERLAANRGATLCAYCAAEAEREARLRRRTQR